MDRCHVILLRDVYQIGEDVFLKFPNNIAVKLCYTQYWLEHHLYTWNHY